MPSSFTYTNSEIIVAFSGTVKSALRSIIIN